MEKYQLVMHSNAVRESFMPALNWATRFCPNYTYPQWRSSLCMRLRANNQLAFQWTDGKSILSITHAEFDKTCRIINVDGVDINNINFDGYKNFITLKAATILKDKAVLIDKASCKTLLDALNSIEKEYKKASMFPAYLLAMQIEDAGGYASIIRSDRMGANSVYIKFNDSNFPDLDKLFRKVVYPMGNCKSDHAFSYDMKLLSRVGKVFPTQHFLTGIMATRDEDDKDGMRALFMHRIPGMKDGPANSADIMYIQAEVEDNLNEECDNWPNLPIKKHLPELVEDEVQLLMTVAYNQHSEERSDTNEDKTEIDIEPDNNDEIESEATDDDHPIETEPENIIEADNDEADDEKTAPRPWYEEDDDDDHIADTTDDAPPELDNEGGEEDNEGETTEAEDEKEEDKVIIELPNVISPEGREMREGLWFVQVYRQHKVVAVLPPKAIEILAMAWLEENSNSTFVDRFGMTCYAFNKPDNGQTYEEYADTICDTIKRYDKTTDIIPNYNSKYFPCSEQADDNETIED